MWSNWWNEHILPEQMEYKYSQALTALQDEGRLYKDDNGNYCIKRSDVFIGSWKAYELYRDILDKAIETYMIPTLKERSREKLDEIVKKAKETVGL